MHAAHDLDCVDVADCRAQPCDFVGVRDHCGQHGVGRVLDHLCGRRIGHDARHRLVECRVDVAQDVMGAAVDAAKHDDRERRNRRPLYPP